MIRRMRYIFKMIINIIANMPVNNYWNKYIWIATKILEKK